MKNKVWFDLFRVDEPDRKYDSVFRVYHFDNCQEDNDLFYSGGERTFRKICDCIRKKKRSFRSSTVIDDYVFEERQTFNLYFNEEDIDSVVDYMNDCLNECDLQMLCSGYADEV